MNRRSRIFDNIDAVLKKDWRTEAEVLAEPGGGDAQEFGDDDSGEGADDE
jgi:hypothetical protein